MILLVPILIATLAHGRATKREDEDKQGPAVDEPIDTGKVMILSFFS